MDILNIYKNKYEKYCNKEFKKILDERRHDAKKYKLGWNEDKEKKLVQLEPMWEWICTHKDLSEEFMDKYADKLHWYSIGFFQIYSEEFIEKHVLKYGDKFNWQAVFRSKNSDGKYISEEFIERHIERMDEQYCWINVPYSRPFSESFINKYIDKFIEGSLGNVIWYAKKHKTLLKEFIKKLEKINK